MDYSKKTKAELLAVLLELKQENDSLVLRLNTEKSHLIEVEHKVKKGDDRFREVLENSLDVAYKFDLKTNQYEYFSPVFTSISGYTPKEFLNLPMEIRIARLIHPDDIPNVDVAMTEIFSTDLEAGLFEYRFKRKDGHYRWFADKYKVIRDSNGEPVSLIGNIADIQKQKLAEEALWRSEAKFRNLAENLVELVFQADPVTTRATYVNNAVEKVYGYSVDEWLNDPSLWVNSIFPEDKERVLNQYAIAQNKFDDLVLSYRIIRKDKAIRHVEARTSWLKDEHGNVISINGFIYDITDRFLTENALNS